MTAERLSALDASFLAVEGPRTPMHVGWVALLDAPEDEPRPGHGGARPRTSQRRLRGRDALPPAPGRASRSGCTSRCGSTTPASTPRATCATRPGQDLDAIVDGILSTPLPRDRPLWEIHVADELADGRIALVGKMHHCMVDGAAVAELGNRAARPRARRLARAGGRRRRRWAAAPAPVAPRAAGPRDGRPGRPTASRSRSRRRGSRPHPPACAALPAAAGRGVRTLGHTLLPPAPGSPLNRPGSARRRHVRVTRPLDDIRAVRRRFGVTPNDVVLAACAGALRRFAERRGEPPQRLKAMVPGGRALERGRGGQRQPHRVPVHRAAVRRARPRRAAAGDQPRDGAAPRRRRGRRRRRRVPRALPLAAPAAAGARPRVRPPAPVQPHGLERARARRCRATCAAAAWPRGALRRAAARPPRALDRRRHRRAGRRCFGLYADAETLPDADVLAADARRGARRAAGCARHERDAASLPAAGDRQPRRGRDARHQRRPRAQRGARRADPRDRALHRGRAPRAVRAPGRRGALPRPGRLDRRRRAGAAAPTSTTPRSSAR